MNLVFDKTHLLQEKKRTTLILTDEAEQDIIGGTSLTKRELSYFQEEIRRLIPTGTFCRGYVWECSTIYFASSQNINFESAPPEHLSRCFYRGLYEALVGFGQQKEVRFVIVKLTAEAYLPTKVLGLWPYIVQFLPGEVPDDHFYGILPLRGCFYEKYQENWEDLDKGENGVG